MGNILDKSVDTVSSVYQVYQLEKLTDALLIRIQGSFIISFDNVQTIAATHIQINNVEIPMGRFYKNIVLKQLKSKYA